MEKELLQRYIDGSNLTNEEIAYITAWLDSSEENVREYQAMHKLQDILLWNKQTDRALPKRALRRGVMIEVLKVAAVIAVTFILSQLWMQKSANAVAWQTLYVPAGQRAELTLNDGTKVWLNAKSTLIFPTRFEKDKRKVELIGEGYFEVTSNPKQPFYVETKRVNVCVTGTEFNVSAYTANFDIALLKGAVSLFSSTGEELYKMVPNQQVVLQDKKMNVSTIKDKNYFRWREGLICFDNETVGNIINKLRLYYDVSIAVERPDLLSLRYTGKFRTKDGIEQVLKVLQLEHRFTYIKNNETNCITIK